MKRQARTIEQFAYWAAMSAKDHENKRKLNTVDISCDLLIGEGHPRTPYSYQLWFPKPLIPGENIHTQAVHNSATLFYDYDERFDEQKETTQTLEHLAEVISPLSREGFIYLEDPDKLIIKVEPNSEEFNRIALAYNTHGPFQ